MTRLRLVAFSELAKVAEKRGYRRVRQTGSHVVFCNETGKIIVIPDHGSQVIVRPLLRKILRDLGISPEEFDQFLKSK